MTPRRRSTHVVVDTDVFNWYIDPRPNPRTDAVREIIGTRTRVSSFITVAEVHYGAIRAGWGGLRLRRLLRALSDLDVIHTNDRLVIRSAELRAGAVRAGHPIAQKVHEADRWVAATALTLDLELLAGDGIFDGIAGLDVLRVPPS